MALLDLIRSIPERMGRGMERNIGGLLGIDPEDMTEEERKQARRLSQMAVFDAMARGTSPIAGLRQAAELLGTQRAERAQRREAEQRMGAAQQASSQIAGRLLGGAPIPTAPGPAAGDELTGVNVESQYRRDPMDALRIGMSQAGADAMRINPFLQAPLQQMLAPQEGMKLTDDMREYQMARAQGYQGSFMDYMRDVKSAGAQKIVLPSQVGQTEYERTAGKAKFESQQAAYNAAQQAQDNLAKVYETASVIESGQPFTGALAEAQLNIARIKQAVDQRDDKRISDTEVLNALLGSDVFSMLGQLGVGARGLDTPAEREFLREVITGTISLNRETLKRMTEIRANVMERAIDRFNQRVDKGEMDDYFKAMGIQKQKFEKPARPSMQGFVEGQRAVDDTGRVAIFRDGKWRDARTGEVIQ